MNKTALRKKIDNILGNIPDESEIIQIIYVNPITGEQTILECYPDRNVKSNLTVQVDSPATAETFKKLREQKT